MKPQYFGFLRDSAASNKAKYAEFYLKKYFLFQNHPSSFFFLRNKTGEKKLKKLQEGKGMTRTKGKNK